jgi:hypothetical protein
MRPITAITHTLKIPGQAITAPITPIHISITGCGFLKEPTQPTVDRGAMSDPIHDALAKAAARGREIRGGCDLCDAYQTMSEEMPGMYALTVHHDDWCPVLLAHKAGTN